MKTLDEVIMCLEGCGHIDCDDCPYHYEDEKIEVDDCAQVYKDALHYLKELRDMTDIPMEYFESGGTSQKLRNTSQITCPKCHSEFVILPDANNPLTWQELQHMEGKPVWVEYNLHIGNKDFRDNSKRWCIVREFKPWHDTEIIITENGFVLSKNEQIKCWQAYRKERS